MDPVHERQIAFHAVLRGVRCEVSDSAAQPAVECKTMQPTGNEGQTDPQGADGQEDPNAALVAELLQHNAMLLESIIDTVQDFDTSRRQSLRELQTVACELAVAVASHVIHKEINKDAFAIETLVQQAIGRLDTSGPLTMRVHPDDLVRLDALWQSSDTPHPENVRFVADDSLTPGSCLAETQDLGLLSTLDARLAEIRQALLEGIDDAQIERRKTDEKSKTVRRFPDRRETA